MTTNPPSPEGEVLKLGPPAAGEVVIKVDPRAAGTSFSAGTETLLPGAEIPVHKHLHQDEVVFVHKGQARATVNDRNVTVVPGTMVYVPRGAWHGLRNTGTGVLQITWTSAPPGLEEFFRELSRLSGPTDFTALQALASRHGIEFRPPEAAPPPVPRRGRHHRRRRGRGSRGTSQTAQPRPSGQAHPGQTAPAEMKPVPTTPPASSAAMPVSAPPRREGRHRRRRGRRGGAGVPGPQPERRAQGGAAAPAPAPSPVQPPASTRRESRRGRGRPGRVKEVYMGGRWIRVAGEGPVISGGSEQAQKRGDKRRGDDDTPGGPLTVPL